MKKTNSPTIIIGLINLMGAIFCMYLGAKVFPFIQEKIFNTQGNNLFFSPNAGAYIMLPSLILGFLLLYTLIKYIAPKMGFSQSLLSRWVVKNWTGIVVSWVTVLTIFITFAFLSFKDYVLVDSEGIRESNISFSRYIPWSDFKEVHIYATGPCRYLFSRWGVGAKEHFDIVSVDGERIDLWGATGWGSPSVELLKEAAKVVHLKSIPFTYGDLNAQDLNTCSSVDLGAIENMIEYAKNL